MTSLFQVEAVPHGPQHLVVDALAVTVDKFFSSAEASIDARGVVFASQTAWLE